MAQVMINKFVVNSLYYAKVAKDGKVEFMRPTTLEDFDNVPEGWDYTVCQFGGATRSVEVCYKDNRLVMPYVTPKEAVRLFEANIRQLADIAITVEKSI